MEYENKVRKLVALNDLNVPLSALHKRAYRKSKNLASNIERGFDKSKDFGSSIVDVVYENQGKSRELRSAIDEFSSKYPNQGRHLQRLISVNRASREMYLNYGIRSDDSISDEEYISVMRDIGLSDTHARELYPTLVDISDTMKEKSGLRSILIGHSAY